MGEPALRIPGTLNLVLLLLGSVGAGAALWSASHTSPTWMIVGIVAYGLLGNLLFALLHDAVHGSAHQRRGLNETIGVIAGWWFPTSLTAQRHFHLGHHRRNRSDVECWDLVLPGDRPWLKRLQLWTILSGWYWITAPVFGLLHLLVPGLPGKIERVAARDVALGRTSGGAMLAGLSGHGRIRLETLGWLAWWGGCWWLLDLRLLPTCACLAAFAWWWSSLQYTDHAFSPRHVVDGAWDLRVTPPLRWCFLNYHLHGAHHRHPELSWLHLPAHVDHARPRPTFWWVYLRLWFGPYESDRAPRPR